MVNFRGILAAVLGLALILAPALADARAGRFRAAILIDYPGFHLRLGAGLRRAGVPVLWYVAPQLWAWAPGRLGRLRQATNTTTSAIAHGLYDFIVIMASAVGLPGP